MTGGFGDLDEGDRVRHLLDLLDQATAYLDAATTIVLAMSEDET